MNRRVSILAGVVVALWLAAAMVWVTIPPRPSVAACGTAVERVTRDSLIRDPNLVEIVTPPECVGFSADELYEIIAATTPIPRPTGAPVTSAPAPTRAAPAPRRTTRAPAPITASTPASGAPSPEPSPEPSESPEPTPDPTPSPSLDPTSSPSPSEVPA